MIKLKKGFESSAGNRLVTVVLKHFLSILSMLLKEAKEYYTVLQQDKLEDNIKIVQ